MGPKKEGKRRNNGRKKIDVKQTPVAERQRLFSECSEDQCSVCWNDIKLFASGFCNHATCHICSIRMRVLCAQNDCAICRQDMPKIILSETKSNFEDMTNDVMLMDRKYQICFQNDMVKKQYDTVLEHKCPKCTHDQPVVFRNFKQLDQHVRREHELFFCELCSNNLKIFSHERKLYTRAQLATHRRKGDPDDSSHRGHPLCKFCEVRYVDDDELFRHLRRDHFFCHFCDADGIQEYYPSYGSLRDHFQNNHFICLQGNCENEQFTHAFRSDLDLKAHRMEKHGQSLSKSEARLNRTVDVDVTFNRSNQNHGHHHRRGHHGHNSTPEFNEQERSDKEIPEKVPDLAQDFPSLNGATAIGGLLSNNTNGQTNSNSLAKKLAVSSGRNVQSSWGSSTKISANMKEEDFPSLPGANSTPVVPTATKPYNYQQETSKKPKKIGPKPNKGPDFPELPTANSQLHSFGTVYRNPSEYTPAWSSHSKDRANNNNNNTKVSKIKNVAPAPILDFPALDSPSGPLDVKQPKSSNPKKPMKPAEQKVTKPKKQQNNAASLASAADLIFNDKPKLTATKKQDQAMTKPSSQLVDMVENNYVKGIKNDGYAQSATSSSINIVSSLPPREPPPGFVTLNKKTAVVRPKPSSKRAYISPPDFNARNSKLMGTISTAFGGAKSLEFNKFKGLSNQFRSGKINAINYLEECSNLLDNKKKFDDFMPEMIALLPNISKQTELLEAFMSKFPKSKLPTQCEICGQILQDFDQRIHREYHDLDTDFPAL